MLRNTTRYFANEALEAFDGLFTCQAFPPPLYLPSCLSRASRQSSWESISGQSEVRDKTALTGGSITCTRATHPFPDVGIHRNQSVSLLRKFLERNAAHAFCLRRPRDCRVALLDRGVFDRQGRCVLNRHRHCFAECGFLEQRHSARHRVVAHVAGAVRNLGHFLAV